MEPGVELPDFLDLRQQPPRVLPVGLEGTPAVVGDAEVLHAQVACRTGHFLESVVAVAGRRVAMEGAAQVFEGQEVGQFVPGCGLDLAEVFAQLGRDVVHP